TKKLLDRLYPLRKCNNPKGRYYRYYQLGQCLAGSEHTLTREEYDEIVKEITQFLQALYKTLKHEIEEKMYEESDALQFERAQEYKEQIEHIEAVMEQQKVVISDRSTIDIFGYSYNKGWLCVQVFYVREGKLVERDVSIFPFY